MSSRCCSRNARRRLLGRFLRDRVADRQPAGWIVRTHFEWHSQLVSPRPVPIAAAAAQPACPAIELRTCTADCQAPFDLLRREHSETAGDVMGESGRIIPYHCRVRGWFARNRVGGRPCECPASTVNSLRRKLADLVRLIAVPALVVPRNTRRLKLAVHTDTVTYGTPTPTGGQVCHVDPLQPPLFMASPRMTLPLSQPSSGSHAPRYGPVPPPNL